MTFPDGYILSVVLNGIMWICFGIIVLAPVHEIVIRLKNRILQIATPVLVAILGYFLLLGVYSVSVLLRGELVFGLPMAVLLALFVLPKRLIPSKPDFYSIAFCHILISVLGYITALSAPSENIILQSAEQIRLTFAIWYTGIFILEFACASLVFIIMGKIRPQCFKNREKIP
jgi:hypothetical protein